MKLKQIETLADSLSRGPVLRKVFALALRILAGVCILAGLFLVLGGIGETINVIRYSAAQALGIILSLALLVCGIIVVVKVLFYRAGTIHTGGADQYPIVHLSALLLRTGGELSALFIGIVGTIAGVMIWFGGEFPFLPFLWNPVVSSADPSFFLGLTAILSSLFQAVLALLCFYLVAELLLLFRNIALNTQSKN